MKKIIVALISLSSVSLTALELNMTAAAAPAATAPLVNHTQASKAINSNDFTKLEKLLAPLKAAIAQIESQNATASAPSPSTDTSVKGKTPVATTTSTTDTEAQTDDNILDDLVGTLMPLVDSGNPTNLTSLLTQAEKNLSSQAQKAASPTNSMSAGRRALTGVAALLVGGAATYFGIAQPIEKKQDGTIITGIMTAGGLVFYGFYDIYLAITNHDAKTGLAHAQANVSTLQNLHAKTQTIVANSPRTTAATMGLPTAPVAVSLNPAVPLPTTDDLIDLNNQKKS